MTVIPIVIGALGTVTKGLLKILEDLEIRERVEDIQTTALMRLARILRRVLGETCCHSNSNEKQSANAGGKNSQKSKIIDKTQQNSQCRLCGDRDETINHIISECSKLAQEYKTRHDWVGKVINWEMCEELKFDHTNKWYVHNPAPVQENDTHKLLRDFDEQTDHLISARKPDLIKLKKCEKKEKYLDLARELKKLWNTKMTIIPIVIDALGTVTQGLLKGLEDLEVGGRVETIQPRALLRTARILRRVLVT